LFVEWYDGANWQSLAQVRPGTWTLFDKLCPAAAANNAAFKIRVRLNSGHANGEWVRLDNVEAR
jgi:hypothetical protein